MLNCPEMLILSPLASDCAAIQYLSDSRYCTGWKDCCSSKDMHAGVHGLMGWGSRSYKGAQCGDDVAEFPYREATILEQLHHPHIIP